MLSLIYVISLEYFDLKNINPFSLVQQSMKVTASFNVTFNVRSGETMQSSRS